MKSNYPACLAEVLKWEGGWSNHPSDPGGATMKGVTQKTYDTYRGKSGKAKQSVKYISEAELQDIYRRNYWDAINGDNLPSGVDLAVFDFAVNSGPGRAVKYFNGVNGPSARTTINALCDKRMAFLRGLGTWKVFGKGWTNRVEGVRTKALRMASGAAVAPIRPVPATPVPQTPAAAPRPSLWARIKALFKRS